MTPRETWSAFKGHKDKVERYLKTSWNQTRWLGTVVLSPHSKKKINPRDLMKFPWDDDDGPHDLEAELDKLKEMRKWRR